MEALICLSNREIVGRWLLQREYDDYHYQLVRKEQYNRCLERCKESTIDFNARGESFEISGNEDLKFCDRNNCSTSPERKKPSSERWIMVGEHFLRGKHWDDFDMVPTEYLYSAKVFRDLTGSDNVTYSESHVSVTELP
ncbi:hypothetical protein ACLOJK_018249 [Asimina triloba]